MHRDTARLRIIVAVDVDSVDKAKKIVEPLAGKVAGFKFGFEFFWSVFASLITAKTSDEAHGLVDRLRDLFAIVAEEEFIDCKIADISNTIKGAAKAITRIRPLMFNMHAFAGSAAMKAAREAVDTITEELLLPQKPLLLAVTLLTTIGEDDLAELGLKSEDDTKPRRLELVVRYAKLAQKCGCDGVIASPLEVTAIREACGTDFLILTPGVRLPGANQHDQKNVATPGMSIADGADGVVVGRDITGAANPQAAVERIIDNIVEAASASSTTTA